MPVNARRLIRKMRGGAQAHLLECDDGRYYVVKFRNNPQHRRILVNEWISSVFLNYLEISCPKTAVVHLNAEFIKDNPELSIQLGSSREPPEEGWHFGSAYPGDPFRLSVFDFLPDTLLEKVANLNEFLGALVFDKWTGNADSRQAIFFRAQIELAGQEHPVLRERTSPRFVTQMMDHGYIFDGPHWSLNSSPLQGLYFRPLVYRQVRGYEDFQPWLDRVVHFPEEVVDEAWKRLPPQWLEGDEAALEALLVKLMKRRKRVPDLVREASNGRLNPFPNWT